MRPHKSAIETYMTCNVRNFFGSCEITPHVVGARFNTQHPPMQIKTQPTVDLNTKIPYMIKPAKHSRQKDNSQRLSNQAF